MTNEDFRRIHAAAHELIRLADTVGIAVGAPSLEWAREFLVHYPVAPPNMRNPRQPRIIAAVAKSTTGLTCREIGEATGIRPNHVWMTVSLMAREGKLLAYGKKGSTKYFDTVEKRDANKAAIDAHENGIASRRRDKNYEPKKRGRKKAAKAQAGHCWTKSPSVADMGEVSKASTAERYRPPKTPKGPPEVIGMETAKRTVAQTRPEALDRFGSTGPVDGAGFVADWRRLRGETPAVAGAE